MTVNSPSRNYRDHPLYKSMAQPIQNRIDEIVAGIPAEGSDLLGETRDAAARNKLVTMGAVIRRGPLYFRADRKPREGREPQPPAMPEPRPAPPDEPGTEPAAESRGRGRPKGSQVPQPRVSWTEPPNQITHLIRILNNRNLTAFEQHIGMVVHTLIGLEKRDQFCSQDRAVNLPNAEIAMNARRAGSVSKVSAAMKTLVEEGHFRRLDNGQGNTRKPGKSAASAYVPIVPTSKR